jgi:hypothetical protein
LRFVFDSYFVYAVVASSFPRQIVAVDLRLDA